MNQKRQVLHFDMKFGAFSLSKVIMGLVQYGYAFAMRCCAIHRIALTKISYHMDNKKCTSKNIFSTFDTMLKRFRSLIAVNLEFVGQKAAKLLAIKL